MALPIQYIHAKKSEFAELLYEENEKALHGLGLVPQKPWQIADYEHNLAKDKITPIALIMKCYERQLNTISNRKVITELMDFLQNLKSRATKLEERCSLARQEEVFIV